MYWFVCWILLVGRKAILMGNSHSASPKLGTTDLVVNYCVCFSEGTMIMWGSDDRVSFLSERTALESLSFMERSACIHVWSLTCHPKTAVRWVKSPAQSRVRDHPTPALTPVSSSCLLGWQGFSFPCSWRWPSCGDGFCSVLHGLTLSSAILQWMLKHLDTRDMTQMPVPDTWKENKNKK